MSIRGWAKICIWGHVPGVSKKFNVDKNERLNGCKWKATLNFFYTNSGVFHETYVVYFKSVCRSFLPLFFLKNRHIRYKDLSVISVTTRICGCNTALPPYFWGKQRPTLKLFEFFLSARPVTQLSAVKGRGISSKDRQQLFNRWKETKMSVLL